MTRPLSRREYIALARFRYALRVFQHFSDDAARASGLTPSQHQLLLAIKGWDGEQPPSIADLAGRLQLKHHSTVELIKRATEAGNVVSTRDPHDRRRQLPELTAQGEELLASLSVLHRDELRRFRTEMHDVLSELA